jgi:hypothetical protein
MLGPKTLFDKAIDQPWITVGDELHYAIEIADDTVFLFLEGTVDGQNWKSDFDFFPESIQPYKGAEWYAHEGFAKLWKSGRDIIVPQVCAALVSRQNLVIAGYSLGGSLTVLAHEDFYFTLGKYAGKINSVAFAPARVMWLPTKDFEERFDRLTCYMRRDDLVPHVPFAVLGYRHVGTCHWLGKWWLPWYTHHLQAEYDVALAALNEG